MKFKVVFLTVTIFLFLMGIYVNTVAQNKNSDKNKNQGKGKLEKIQKSKEEWKKELSEAEYKVTREKGTERAFTGDLYYNKETGKYTCRCCGLELFDSKQKFDSGSGWPSFYDVLDKTHIVEKKDYSYGMVRIEILCARCDAHLGHVFDDGPNPTGLRYCINSVSLDFKKNTNK